MLLGTSLACGKPTLMRSMTGFGRSEATSSIGSLTVEMRSVNHRYCQVTTSLPNEFALFEPAVATEIKGWGARGQIHVHVAFRHGDDAGAMVPRVNHAYVAALVRSARAIAARHGLTSVLADETTAAALLQFPGVLTTEAPELDEADRWDLLREAVTRAWASMDEMRAKEGEALRVELMTRLAEIRRLREAILPSVADMSARQFERLTRRMKELLADHGVDAEDGRIVVEAGLIADRADVSEELARLGSHCDQFQGLLGEEGQVGRKLDFLLQELNREANTIASKASDADLTSLCVDLKTEIERLREQVQNVE